MSETLRIGFVPEHFSTPLHFAQKHYALSASLLPYPSGTGHMVQALQAGEIDVGVGLTEGWIAALGKAQTTSTDVGFKVVGTYVETPLCWAISTGAKRRIDGVGGLKGKKMGVSRVGRCVCIAIFSGFGVVEVVDCTASRLKGWKCKLMHLL